MPKTPVVVSVPTKLLVKKAAIHGCTPTVAHAMLTLIETEEIEVPQVDIEIGVRHKGGGKQVANHNAYARSAIVQNQYPYWVKAKAFGR